MRTAAPGMPAHVQPQITEQSHPLTTAQFAALNRLQKQSVQARLSKTGSFYGLRPLKLASGRVFWPAIVVTAEVAANLAAAGARTEGGSHE